MDLTDSPDERTFRESLRSWLAENPVTAPPKDETARAQHDREWHRRLHDGGYAGVTWPRSVGGRGATGMERVILSEELERAGAFEPRTTFVGISMVGPVLMRHGTEEQKRCHLPPILAGDELWCQGFSEPDAGSDLAALKTRAVEVADGWSVSGQKTWTSYAHLASWCLLLARTDPDAPKHRGLSLFLLNLGQTAVDVRPLRQLTGDCEFSELFLDGAHIPRGGLVGEVNHGWSAAMSTLMHERAGMGFSSALELRRSLDRVVGLCRRKGILERGEVRQTLAQLYIETQAVGQHVLRALTRETLGAGPGPEGSLPKWQAGEVGAAIAAFALTHLGEEVVLGDGRLSHDFLYAGIPSVGGGTTEIQKNTIAHRVLGLPRS